MGLLIVQKLCKSLAGEVSIRHRINKVDTRFSVVYSSAATTRITNQANNNAVIIQGSLETDLNSEDS